MSIPAKGIHSIPDQEYFAIDLPSSSSTKTLLSGTNAHLAHERENPREDTDAFTLGAFVHAMLLAPESIETDFIRVGDIDRRTKAGREEWETVQRRASLTGARVITRALVEQGEAMRDAVLSNPAAAALIHTAHEREATVIGEICGRPAKAKVDGIIRFAGDRCVVLDIKTTESASPRDFGASAAKFGYFHQAAFYRRLVEQAIATMDEFVIVAIEKKPPYLTAVYRIPDIAIEVADRKLDALVERWWVVRGGDRTGYPQTVTELEPPRWWLAND
jgi:hypothetical protein